MTGKLLHNPGRKYVPHLPSLLQVCEHNYGRLLRLLPDCDTEDLIYRFEVSPLQVYQIRIVECSRYTTTVEIEQQNQRQPAFMRQQMEVRLYHDAQMAEVLRYQRKRAVRGSYPYPNKDMHHANEKEQMNRFLAEWLSFCLRHTRCDSSPA